MKSLIESLESRRLLTGNIICQWLDEEGGALVVSQGRSPEQEMIVDVEWRFSYLNDDVRCKINGVDYDTTQLIIYGSDFADSITVSYKPSVMQLTNGSDFVVTYIESGDGDDIIFVDAEPPTEDVDDTLDLTYSLYVDVGTGNDIWGGSAIGILKDQSGISYAYLGSPYYDSMIAYVEMLNANSVAFLPDGTGYGGVGTYGDPSLVLFTPQTAPNNPNTFNIVGLFGPTLWSSLGNRPAPMPPTSPKFSDVTIDVLAGEDVLAEVA